MLFRRRLKPAINEDSAANSTISQRIDPSVPQHDSEIEDMREQLIVNINRKPATDALFNDGFSRDTGEKDKY